ncbi:MAG TPA: diguanylate cyclase [Thermoanaerobaculia bacterium]|nr:diguanylate cyclase [Thermoanaerobaculia bacterium]
MSLLRRSARGARPAWRALLLAACAAGVARAEEPTGPSVFRTFTNEEGFATPVLAEHLLQDRAGFLWAGTADGLYRYDGRVFTRFGVADGLPSARVTALHETKDGRFYVGTLSGLARLDGVGFRALGAKSGLPEATVADLASDAAGTVFVATPKGLFTSLSELFHIDARKDGPERPITALAADASGALFFARDGRLLRREKGITQDWGASRALPPLERIDDLAVSGGRLWVRSLSRFLSAPLAGGPFLAEDEGLPPAAVWGRIAFDASGAPVLPTARGLAERRASRWRLVTRREGLPADVVLAALVDREGSLWVSVAGVGLANRPGRGDFTAFARREGLAGESVLAIARERGKTGALWVGTDEGLTRLAMDGAARSFTEKDGLAGNAVFALATAEDGGVWAGSLPGGVTRVSPDGRTKRYGAAGLAPQEFQVLALRARQGEVWAGAATGVFRLAPGAALFEHVAVPGGEEPDTIYGLVEDRAGGLFAFGRFGLSRLLPSARRFRRRNGLKGDFVSSATADESGLVIAYRDARGLERVVLEGEKLLLSAFAPKGVPVPERAAFVGRDARGAFWVGSSGVDVFRPDGPPLHFGRSDGLVADEVNLNAFFADADGTVWIGTKRGLARRSAAPLQVPRPAPPVAFTLAEAGARRLAPDRPAVLSARERSLRIAWAGLGFSDARRLRYRYRLEGLDDAETETALPEVTLKGLPPGSYRLSVAAVSPAGAPGKPSGFVFRVAPAWHQTLAARLFLLGLLAAAVYALVERKTRVLRDENERLAHELDLFGAQLHAKDCEIEEASLTDALTGLRNRRFFFAVMTGEIERAIRANAPLATPAERRAGDILLFFVEVDRLKDVNERFGNAAGDRVLIEAVRRLKGAVRSSDFLVRWGGNVFLIATRSTQRDQGHVFAERVLMAFANQPFAVDDAPLARTCSIGWAPFPWTPQAPEVVPFEESLRFADRALENAKRSGRNRAVGALPGGGKRGEAAPSIEGLEGVPLRVVSTEGPRPTA